MKTNWIEAGLGYGGTLSMSQTRSGRIIATMDFDFEKELVLGELKESIPEAIESINEKLADYYGQAGEVKGDECLTHS